MANRRSSSERHERRCALCHRSILDDEKAARHHPKLKSEGGIEIVEVHANCHVVRHSVLGALVGSVIAYFGAGLLVRILASGPMAENLKIEVQPNLNLLLFTAFVTTLAAVLFGLAPAWYVFRNASATSLRHVGKGGDRSGRLFEHSLVSVQVALSVLLVSAATMFVGHVSRMRTLDLGFRSDNVLLMILNTSKTGFNRTQLAPRLQELQERMRRITGVQSVAIGGCTPIQGCGAMRFVIVDERPEPAETRARVSLNFVSPCSKRTR